MTEHQFHRICERLDKIIKLLETMQNPIFSNVSTDTVKWGNLQPDWTFTPEPDRSTTAVEPKQ